MVGALSTPVEFLSVVSSCPTCGDVLHLVGAEYHCQTCKKWWTYNELHETRYEVKLSEEGDDPAVTVTHLDD